MMKVAEAIKAMHNTLRPGRLVAFLNPSRATAHHPAPWIDFPPPRRSQADWKQRDATSSSIPPPKNPGVCPTRFSADAIKSSTPATPSKVALRDDENKRHCVAP